MNIATKDFLEQHEKACEAQKARIRNASDNLVITGKTYYVSADGNDENDGLSPETSWQTLQRANTAELNEGDGVLFRRGDLFRGGLGRKRNGITFGAYGKGKKPTFYGWQKDLADPALWVEVDAEHHIWRMTEKISDCGTLVFNDGEFHSRKQIPSYIGGQFVCRDNEKELFDMRYHMDQDLDIFNRGDEILDLEPTKGEDFPVPEIVGRVNTWLYLRCDKGNPGKVFRTIEAVVSRSAFICGDNCTVDNICMKYYVFGVRAGGQLVQGLRVTNCEIGWVGGNIQHYHGTDPNYPQGRRGTVTRFGNAVEIYGGCKDYEVSNCYIYQSYDAGITHQVSTNGNNYIMENVRYTDNLIEHCVYGIEYFLDQNCGPDESYMKDIEMSGNIIRFSGYGWGQQRHNTNTPAHIKGWSYTNPASDYRIHHNIFDRAAYRMVHLVAKEASSLPQMYENTYIQFEGNPLGQYGANNVAEPPIRVFDKDVEKTLTDEFREKDPKVYIIEK